MTDAPDRRTLLGWTGALAGTALASAASAKGKAAAAAPVLGPVVKTSNGAVRGYRAQGVHVFRGLRYGAPTGGANRFKPPVKPAPWTGVMETLIAAGGPSAPQRQDPPTALGAGFSS